MPVRIECLHFRQRIVQDIQPSGRISTRRYGNISDGADDRDFAHQKSSDKSFQRGKNTAREDDLSATVDDLIKLWSDGVKSMDDGLAQTFLQTNMEKWEGSLDGMLGKESFGGGRKPAGLAANASAHVHANKRRGVRARNMQSYGVLSSSSASWTCSPRSGHQRSWQLANICQIQINPTQPCSCSRWCRIAFR